MLYKVGPTKRYVSLGLVGGLGKLTLSLLRFSKAKFGKVDTALGRVSLCKVLELTSEVRSRVVEPGSGEDE